MTLAIVAAVADNGVIGRRNALPWRLATDLRRFRALTWGRPIVMGRRTYESLGRPLPGRETIVVSGRPAFAAAGVHVARSLDEAVALGRTVSGEQGDGSVMIVGGASLYAEALPHAARLHLTLVHAAPDGDVLFPAFDRSAFDETFREAHPPGPNDDHPFTFVDWRRRDRSPSNSPPR